MSRGPKAAPRRAGRPRGGLATRLAGLAVAVALVAGGLAAVLATGPSTAQASTAPLRAAPDGRPLELTFADEFDELRLWKGRTRTGVWRPVFGDGSHRGLDRRSLPTNRERQIYVDPGLSDAEGPMNLNPFSVRNGILRITAERTDPALVKRLNGYEYTSGLITTQPSFRQTYGYFEMRAKLPRGKGLWPAFWLLPADLSWPPEIDVMESIGDPSEAYTTVHSKRTEKKAQGKKTRIAPDQFHVFAVSWDAENLIWYINGKEVFRRPTPDDLHKPMFMLANLAVGGYWPGDPDSSTKLPAHLEIDYIRAYRFAS